MRFFSKKKNYLALLHLANFHYKQCFSLKTQSPYCRLRWLYSIPWLQNSQFFTTRWQKALFWRITESFAAYGKVALNNFFLSHEKFCNTVHPRLFSPRLSSSSINRSCSTGRHVLYYYVKVTILCITE